MSTATAPSLANDRIEVVDVLRAYALFGILITHSITGFLAGQPPTPDYMTFGELDRLVLALDHLFVFGKFYTIFSFLFGLSFAIQLQNATRKGVGFSGRFAWRLTVLAFIGLAHGAFFAGDILIVYAILGLLLIPFRNTKTRTLLIVGLILALNVPGLLLGAVVLALPSPEPAQVQANAAMQAQFLQASIEAYAIKQSGSLAELARVNFTGGMFGKLVFLIFTGRLWMTFGLFLLGMCAGRLEIFRDSDASGRFFRKLLWPAGAVALVTTLAEWRYPVGEQMQSAGDLAKWFSFTIQQVSLSAFYMAGITLLYWRQSLHGILHALAPVGRMGLTTYLSQTAFGVLLFYGIGFGLLGHIGAAAAAGASIAFFALQILFARLWSKGFRMGPVEWLWRSLTYFTVHPRRN
jgi:uncharacterized protein